MGENGILYFIFYIKEKKMVPWFWSAPRDVLVEGDVVSPFLFLTRLIILLFFSTWVAE